MGRAGRASTALLVAVVALTAVPAAAHAAPDAEYTRYRDGQYHWHHDDLTWSLRGSTAGVTNEQAVTAIQAALDSWGRASRLTFTFVDDCTATGLDLCDDEPDEPDSEPDIRVWFATTGHDTPHTPGDREFTGEAGHGIYPLTVDGPGLAGDIHLDDSKTWHVDGAQVPDLQSIVTHEAGHALGLRHPTDPSDDNPDPPDIGIDPGSPNACPAVASPTRPIMCSTIIGAQRGLAPDDIHGIQALYGIPAHAVDGTIRRSIDRTAIGDDILNTNGRGQSTTFSRARNQRANFFIRVTNDGAEGDTVTLQAPVAPAGFGYRYYVGPTGTTPATGITRGGYETVALASEAGITIRVEVTVKANAVRHRSQGLLIRATSQADATRVDVVRPIVKVT